MFPQRLMHFCAIVLMNTMLVLSLGCAATKPLPQPRRVIDPSTVSGAVQTPRWDIGAVHYEHFGQGMDYTQAGLEPIFLVFKNKSLQTPVIQVEEIRGVGRDGEYLPYSLDEATTLVFASESFSVTASNASRTGALGAFLGAGLGALIGTIGGGDNIWKGAAIGAIGGAVVGGAAGTVASPERDLKYAVRKELGDYGWTNEPVPSDYTKVGYVYFPAKVGVDAIKLVVRVDGQIQSYTIDAADVAKQ